MLHWLLPLTNDLSTVCGCEYLSYWQHWSLVFRQLWKNFFVQCAWLRLSRRLAPTVYYWFQTTGVPWKQSESETIICFFPCRLGSNLCSLHDTERKNSSTNLRSYKTFQVHIYVYVIFTLTKKIYQHNTTCLSIVIFSLAIFSLSSLLRHS